MKSRITMSDIALRAGVHVTTVSMALRNHRNLPAKTIDRIKSLAEEMGYRPDPALKALVAYRNKQSKKGTKAALAYITNWNNKRGWEKSPAHLRFYEGAKAKADELGYRLEHFWLGEPALSQKRMNDMFIARGVNGLLFASHMPKMDSELLFDWSQFSAVKIDFYPRRPQLHSVSNDQSAIAKLIFEKVQEYGYKRIGIAFPQIWDEWVRNAWSAGFLAAQQFVPENDRVPIFKYTIPFQPDLSAPAKPLQDWLETHQPDALISYKPFVWERLKDLGIKPPKDLGYADLFLEQTKGSTAGVLNNCERVGEIAIEQLVTQIQLNTLGIPDVQTTTLVEGSWVDGKTLRKVNQEQAIRS